MTRFVALFFVTAIAAISACTKERAQPPVHASQNNSPPLRGVPSKLAVQSELGPGTLL